MTFPMCLQFHSPTGLFTLLRYFICTLSSHKQREYKRANTQENKLRKFESVKKTQTILKTFPFLGTMHKYCQNVIYM